MESRLMCNDFPFIFLGILVHLTLSSWLIAHSLHSHDRLIQESLMENGLGNVESKRKNSHYIFQLVLY